MADISLKFGTPKAVSFREKGISDPKSSPGPWFCTCGSENNDSAKFCPECGTPRPQEATLS